MESCQYCRKGDFPSLQDLAAHEAICALKLNVTWEKAPSDVSSEMKTESCKHCRSTLAEHESLAEHERLCAEQSSDDEDEYIGFRAHPLHPFLTPIPSPSSCSGRLIEII